MRAILLRAVAVIILAVIAVAPSQASAAAGWEELGTRVVDFGGDRDEIVVGRDDGRFRELMFEAEGGAVRLYNIRVVFGNGEDFSPVTELVFSDDERTRAIDLPGGNRIVRRVIFNYRSLHTGQGRATLTLYGR